MRMIIDRQPIAELWVGADFAMGRGRRGTIAVLAEIGGHLGWGLHMVPPYRLEDQVVSSTAVRTLLGAGAVRGVADLLGRNYSVPGTLSSDGVLLVDAPRALPRPGLTYETQVHQDGRSVDCRAQVLAEGRIQLTGADLLQPGQARVEFTRRLD
jgi:hypothetical protein